MLLATYQPMFRAPCHPILKTVVSEFAKATGDTLGDDFRGEPDPEYTALFGFDPIWCFPAGNFKTAFTHSMLTAPNTMDLFFILDTDNYVRIDKVKHYQAIRDGLSEVESAKVAIAPDCPDYQSEFVVPVDTLSDLKLVFLVRTMKFLAEGMTELLPVFCQDVSVDIPEPLLEVCMPTVMQVAKQLDRPSAFSVPADVEVSESEIAYKRQAECDRMLFSLFLLPAMYRCLNREDFKMDDVLSCSLARDKAMRVFSAMGRWSYGDCSQDEYTRLFEEMAACVIDSSAFFDYLFENGMPGRNEKCPCGSGKKFKKCCGRML